MKKELKITVLDSHSVASLGDAAKVWADSYCEIECGVGSDIKAYTNCLIKGSDGVRVDALNNSEVYVGKSGDIRVKDYSKVLVGEGSTIIAGHDCELKAGNGVVITAGNFCDIEVGQDGVVRCRSGSTVVAEFGTKIIYDSYGLRDQRICINEGKRDGRKFRFKIENGQILEYVDG